MTLWFLYVEIIANSSLKKYTLFGWHQRTAAPKFFNRQDSKWTTEQQNSGNSLIANGTCTRSPILMPTPASPVE
jgi:hypothetical protein